MKGWDLRSIGRHRLHAGVLVPAVAGMLFALPADGSGGQITSASVAGTVRDAQGAALPGVALTLISASRGTTLAAAATEEGSFVFPTGLRGHVHAARGDGWLQDRGA